MVTLHEYLNVRLRQLGNDFEELRKGGKTDINKFCARRLLCQADELATVAQWVEGAESSFKNLYESLSESISDWIYDKN